MHHPGLKVSILGQFGRTAASRIVPKLLCVIKADPNDGGGDGAPYRVSTRLRCIWGVHEF